MAELLADALRSQNRRVILTSLDEARPSDLSQAELLLVGSPAWSGERVVQPMVDFLEADIERLRGKTIAFFGSYDWGEGRYFDHLVTTLRARGLAVHGAPLLWRTTDEPPTPDETAEFLADVHRNGGRPSAG